MKNIYAFMLCVSLPLTSTFITYVFVSVGNTAIALDDNQALILIIALIKMLLLGTTGVFPININNVINRFIGRGRRGEVLLYKVPPVAKFPCTRRLLCEVEAAARSSDNYNNKHPEALNDRNPDEEVSPEEADPLTEVHIEAVRALYRDEDPSGELTPVTRRALGLMEDLTGKSCEEAYRRCPGRFTTEMYFKTVFEEMSFEAENELSLN